MPSGQKSSSATTDDALDRWESSLGLPVSCPVEVELEATRLLSISPRVLHAMGSADLGEAAYVLEQFAFFLQRATNREQTRLRRAEENVRRLIAPHLQKVSAYSWDERKLLAVRYSQAAREQDNERVEAQLRVDRLAYLAARVGGLVKAFQGLQQARSGRD